MAASALRSLAALVVLAALASVALGQGGNAGKPGNSPPADTAKMLATGLRTLLVQALPEPLYEDTKHWGQQKIVSRGIKWRGKLVGGHPEAEYGPKNDGLWWKVRVLADHPADTLTVEIRNLQQPGPGRMTFTALLGLNANVDYERQRWHEGVRLVSSELRARLRIVLILDCEVTSRLEPKGGILPELVFRLRVINSRCGYDDLVVEHVAGVGGDAAKVFGNAFLSAANQWKPSLERNLLARANAAIVKAGDTKEVRISLFGVMKR